MAKVKHQIFIEPRASEYFDLLKKRYGWTGGDAVERLVLFFRQSERAIADLVLDSANEDDGVNPDFDERGRALWPLVVRKRDCGSDGAVWGCQPCGALEPLAEVAFGGLVPVKGFAPFED